MQTQLNAPASLRDRVSPEEWATRVDLAACYRLAAHYGWTDLVYTHISARVPGTDHYLLNPFGYLFDEITASMLIKVDVDGNRLDDLPYPMHRAGFVIHSAVHAARHDAGCVIHNHTRAGVAMSILKDGLLPLSQHAMFFYGNVAYHDTEGIAENVDERTRLARDLGSKSVMILRNHGVLVVGHTIGQAFSMMWHLEKAMQTQLDAFATGREISVPPADIAESVARRGFGRAPATGEVVDPMGWMEWPALLRLADRLDRSYRK